LSTLDRKLQMEEKRW